MPSAHRFVLKDSHPAILEAAAGRRRRNRRAADDRDDLRGRRYTAERAEQIGGIKSSELLFGVQMACLSITDDKPDTLKNVGILNPWQVESLRIITGSKAEAHAPLSWILMEQFELHVDEMIDISGFSKAGHTLDTQGFIAHNDTTIVLSYRCTTSALDWFTNLTTTMSAWEIEEDVEQGHSGYFSSCADNFSCFGKARDPDQLRVHTGFYNNFLVTVPALRKYIDPLLTNDQPSRTLYVVGHSLGAGIATMAACYYLLGPSFDWKNSPHKLRVVTLGGPRAVDRAMRTAVDTKLRGLRECDKAVFARVVRDKDAVPNVPPRFFGFRHVQEKLVYVTKEDEAGVSSVLINPDLTKVVPKRKMKKLLKKYPNLLNPENEHPIEGEGVSETPGCEEPNGAVSDEDKEELKGRFQRQVDFSGDDEEQKAKSEAPLETNPLSSPTDDDAASTESHDQYRKRINKIPRKLRDHMPEFYLLPVYALCDRESEKPQPVVVENVSTYQSEDENAEQRQRLYAYQEYLTSRESSSLDSGGRQQQMDAACDVSPEKQQWGLFGRPTRTNDTVEL